MLVEQTINMVGSPSGAVPFYTSVDRIFRSSGCYEDENCRSVWEFNSLIEQACLVFLNKEIKSIPKFFDHEKFRFLNDIVERRMMTAISEEDFSQAVRLMELLYLTPHFLIPEEARRQYDNLGIQGFDQKKVITLPSSENF